MARNISSAVHVSRRRPLAACVASLFALSAPAAAIADTWTVDSCDEGSFATPGVNHGTLRYALTHATTPAVINLTGLTGMAACPSSKISLTTGSLSFNLNIVTINGPGAGVLQIDATGLGTSYGNKRVFGHTGSKLTINNLGVTGGHYFRGISFYSAQGGCIYSSGAIELNGATVSTCYAKHADDNVARGGAVYAKGALTVINSTVSHNYARTNTADASGGGVYAGGDITVTSSSIYDNGAQSFSGKAIGAGLFGLGDVTLSAKSFVYSNVATSTSGNAIGGGLYAKGGAGATNSEINDNSVTSTSGSATGGGAYIAGTLSLTKCTVSGNSATSSGSARGGGAAAVSGFSAEYSTIDGNSATSLATGFGGAIYSTGGVTVTNSTISRNSSSGNAGGLGSYGGDYIHKTVTITNSTISGNSAVGIIGGVYTDAGNVNINNSTIAFNTAGAGKLTDYFAPGLAIAAKTYAEAITLQSSILSNNTYGLFENDLSTAFSNPSIDGANNLVRFATATVPVGTLSSCPLLGPLRDNGGLTQTHALMSTSPAIDSGNSTVVNDYDQRGSAATNNILDYIRISGPAGDLTPTADMGAYEVQQSDIIFNNEFETCAELI